MQITFPPVIGGNQAAVFDETSADVSLPELAEGESIEARVIFSSGDAVHLKTAEGAFLRARLEGGVMLSEGTTVALTIVEKGAGLLKLCLSDPLSSIGNEAGAHFPAERNLSLPPALATLVEQLQKSSLQASQKLDAFMRALGDFPASNADTAAIRQAIALLLAEGLDTTPTATALAEAEITAPTARPSLGQMLQHLLALLNIEADAPYQAAPHPRGETAPHVLAPLFDLFLPPQTGGLLPSAGMALPYLPPSPLRGEALSEQAQPGVASGQTAALPQADAVGPPTLVPTLPSATRRELLEFTQRLVMELYQPDAKEPTAKELAAFAARLFVNTGSPSEKVGENLHQAARELEVRLALLKEALAHSSLPLKEVLLQQAERLLQQTTALREEHPFILQLPIRLAEQQQTAELYVYRRKKDVRQIDPRHATVLLALNTEHLGRLEILIQMQQKDLHLKMGISRAEAVPFVKVQSEALTKLLSVAGYRLVSTAVQPLTRQTNPETAQRALEEFRRNVGHQVDIQV